MYKSILSAKRRKIPLERLPTVLRSGTADQYRLRRWLRYACGDSVWVSANEFQNKGGSR